MRLPSPTLGDRLKPPSIRQTIRFVWRPVILGIAVLMLAATGCGSSGDGTGNDDSADSGGDLTLSQAFCNDLKAGYSPFQILGQSVKDGTYTPSTAADRAYGFAAISCPDELRANEMLRIYLQNWNINPDA